MSSPSKTHWFSKLSFGIPALTVVGTLSEELSRYLFTQSKIMSHNSATMPARLGFEVSLGNSRHAAPRVKGPSLERQENTELTDRKDRRQRGRPPF